MRFRTSLGRLTDIGESNATLYRDVWLSALQIRTGRSIDVKGVLKNSEFRKYGADGLETNQYRESLARRCTENTVEALLQLGFEVDTAKLDELGFEVN